MREIQGISLALARLPEVEVAAGDFVMLGLGAGNQVKYKAIGEPVCSKFIRGV